MRVTRLSHFGIVVGMTGLLAGCASYEPQGLDRQPGLVTHAAALDGARGGPITLSDLDRLVLRNNPELRAARAKRGVAAAQLIEAGVLPNPQAAVSYPFYIGGPAGSDGFGLSIAQDVRALLLRPTKRDIAANAASEIDASLLWQEWQTIGKARLLYVGLAAGERSKRIILRDRHFLKDRSDLASTSIDQGNATLATLSPDLVAAGDLEKVSDELDRLQLARRHQLAALLGLAPDAPLALAPVSDVPRLDPMRVRRDLATLADRRPDLVALQYGYRSQDAKLRQAILSQFPNLAIGALGGRDSSFVTSAGPQASFDLPLFDHNEGAIALEDATRTALAREFGARMTAATGEIGALLSEQALLAQQLSRLDSRLNEARHVATQTEAAFKQGAFDERAYVDIERAALAREQEKVALQQALMEGQVALATLIGAGMPPVSLTPETPPDNPLGLLRMSDR